MLLYRPIPYEDECLLSYLIRLAEGNGIGSPAGIMNLAGYGNKSGKLRAKNILTGKSEIKGISKILDLSIDVIREISFQEIEDGGFYLVSGIKIPLGLVRFNNPRVCPGCIKEYGYGLAIWNVVAITSCPEHKCSLVDCKIGKDKRLTWYRNKLNSFPNDDKIYLCDGRPVSNDSLLLSDTILKVVDGNCKELHEDFRGIAIEDFLSLLYWLSFWKHRADSHEMGVKARNKLPIQSWSNHDLNSFFMKGWRAIKNWPVAYYKILEYYSENPMSASGIHGVTLCFRDIYRILKGDNNCRWNELLNKEFDYYIAQIWSGRYLSKMKKMKLESKDLRYISRSQVCKKLRCDIGTVIRYERLGIIKLVERGKGAAIYERAQVEELEVRLRNKLDFKDVCALLHVQRAVLRRLVNSGVIKTFIKPSSDNKKYIFLKEDVESFINMAKRNAKKIKICQVGTVMNKF
ncbi:TniQ family protein [Endozoicomonas elysicola]|uniref:TniQ domain-containing protein n=1 Tax=Endozoicomonas elysicola TaxID=305900 RepID=A0A081KFP6_9GAMM|nr:TniQ family protein [Endozoicomonas elysicola]KEI72972.1 hypothetical protein GV64_21620 [Endozoicomonas elysicola]